MNVTLVAAFALSLVFAQSGSQITHPVPVSSVPYDTFVGLSSDARESMLAQMDRADRFALQRIHAQRWLENNRASLRASQVAIVQEAIDLFSPERYRDPQDPALAKQEADIAHRLACSLGEQRALAAFTFRDEPPAADTSWSGLFDSWAHWLVECLVG